MPAVSKPMPLLVPVMKTEGIGAPLECASDDSWNWRRVKTQRLCGGRMDVAYKVEDTRLQ
jgi:hypothetical protein